MALLTWISFITNVVIIVIALRYSIIENHPVSVVWFLSLFSLTTVVLFEGKMALLTWVSFITNVVIVVIALRYSIIKNHPVSVVWFFGLFSLTTVVLFIVILLGIGMVT